MSVGHLADRRVTVARDKAEAEAWKSLARYKFWMFGYHAAQWVLLNRVALHHAPNPFRCLVDAARRHARQLPLGLRDRRKW